MYVERLFWHIKFHDYIAVDLYPTTRNVKGLYVIQYINI